MLVKYLSVLITIAFTAPSAIQGEEPYIPLVKKNAGETAIGALSTALHRHLVKTANLGEISSTTGSTDSVHIAFLNQVLKKSFLKKGDSVFAYRTIGGQKVAFEFNRMELLGPSPLPLSEADKLNEIDQRISYAPRFKAYRSHDPATGWTEWKPAIPAFIPGIQLQRKNGRWEVKSSPIGRFSVR